MLKIHFRRGQIPREQGVTIAPFSAFHLKTFTSVHGSTSKEEGIVTVDVTVVFQFDPRGRVLLKSLKLNGFVSQVRIVSDQTDDHSSRSLAKEQIILLETRQTLGNVVRLHITAFQRVKGGLWTLPDIMAMCCKRTESLIFT